MDAFSSSSKYDARAQSYGHALIVFATYFCLFVFFRLLFSPFPWFSSTNSEEAKSTTWLHPVTGEAVVTGHRKTPGKHPSHAHTHACEGLLARHGERKKKGGDNLREGKRAFFSLQQSNSLLCSAPPPSSRYGTITHGVHPPPPWWFSTWTLCDTLFKSSVT